MIIRAYIFPCEHDIWVFLAFIYQQRWRFGLHVCLVCLIILVSLSELVGWEEGRMELEIYYGHASVD